VTQWPAFVSALSSTTLFRSEPGAEPAITESLQYAVFHWGIHGWGLYAIVALILAYFKFHRGAPGLISATLEPLFGKKVMRGTVEIVRAHVLTPVTFRSSLPS